MMPASKLGEGRQVVTTAGTREPLTNDAAYSVPTGPIRTLVITALSGNTDKVVVGGAGVIAALATRRGTPLAASETLVLECDDISDVYLDSVVSGEGVSFTWIA